MATLPAQPHTVTTIRRKRTVLGRVRCEH